MRQSYKIALLSLQSQLMWDLWEFIILIGLVTLYEYWSSFWYQIKDMTFSTNQICIILLWYLINQSILYLKYKFQILLYSKQNDSFNQNNIYFLLTRNLSYEVVLHLWFIAYALVNARCKCVQKTRRKKSGRKGYRKWIFALFCLQFLLRPLKLLCWSIFVHIW